MHKTGCTGVLGAPWALLGFARPTIVDRGDILQKILNCHHDIQYISAQEVEPIVFIMTYRETRRRIIETFPLEKRGIRCGKSSCRRMMYFHSIHVFKALSVVQAQK